MRSPFIILRTLAAVIVLLSVVLSSSWSGCCALVEDSTSPETTPTLNTTTAKNTSSLSSWSSSSSSSSFVQDCTGSAVTNNWNASNLAQVVESWKFTAEQQAKLQDFQQRIADISHWKNDPAEAARFLQEHNFDLIKAERMFRGMIQWRQSHGIDTFMEDYGEPPPIFQYSPIFLLKGLDKDQDPIFVQRLGRIDGRGLYHRLGAPAMVQAFRFVSELQTSRTCGIKEEWQWQTRYYEPLVGRRMTQLTILVDLDGLSVRLIRPALLGIVQETARVAQDHYPGLAKRVIVIRAPKIFQMAWKIAKHFYDARVHHKFVFAEQDAYLDVLREYMDLDVLPSVIYDQGHGQPMPGWFEKIHMEGGRIPSRHAFSKDEEEEEEESDEETDDDEDRETCDAEFDTTPQLPPPPDLEGTS